MTVVLFCISLVASMIGAITGIGGGIIIKPTIDAAGILSVSTAGFLSGITVLCMSTVSVARSIKNGIRVQWKISCNLAVGSAVGGICGKWLFDLLKTQVFNEQIAGKCQAAALLFLVISVFLYTIFRSKIKTHNMQNAPGCFAIGWILGMSSAFLGIGGGPINLALLYYVFSMDTKTAAVNSLFIILISQMSSLVFTLVCRQVPPFEISHMLIMAVGGISGGLIGSSILKRINVKGADRIFQILLLVIACICIFNMMKA